MFRTAAGANARKWGAYALPAQSACWTRVRARALAAEPLQAQNPSSAYLQQTLGLTPAQYDDMRSRCQLIGADIAELDLEQSVKPSVRLLLSLKGLQAVQRLLLAQPELLVAPLEAWSAFLQGYGMGAQAFFRSAAHIASRLCHA